MSLGMTKSAPTFEAADERTEFSSELITHVPTLRRYARALVRNAADADDLVQDSLVRALSRMHLYQTGTNLRAWLLSILHHIFLDGMRRNKRTHDFVRAITLMEEGTITRPNQVMRLELMEIDKALALLPPAQRSTLLMVSLEGLSYAETAKATGVPLGTVRSRLSRGRTALTLMVHGVSPEERCVNQKGVETQMSLAS